MELRTETGEVIDGVVEGWHERPPHSVFQRQARTHLPAVSHIQFHVGPANPRLTIRRVLPVAKSGALQQKVPIFLFRRRPTPDGAVISGTSLTPVAPHLTIVGAGLFILLVPAVIGTNFETMSANHLGKVVFPGEKVLLVAPRSKVSGEAARTTTPDERGSRGGAVQLAAYRVYIRHCGLNDAV